MVTCGRWGEAARRADTSLVRGAAFFFQAGDGIRDVAVTGVQTCALPICVMQLAAKFGRPIFTFIDTPGAYPGIDAEERGQGEAIARNLREMSRLPVPVLVTVTGEGGSGGALAVAVGDRVNILGNRFYSVISPEGCAAIMWRDASKAETAAVALKITAKDLKGLGIVDEIVPEPEGGAHTDYEAAARSLDAVLDRQLMALSNQSTKDILEAR